MAGKVECGGGSQTWVSISTSWRVLQPCLGSSGFSRSAVGLKNVSVPVLLLLARGPHFEGVLRVTLSLDVFSSQSGDC